MELTKLAKALCNLVGLVMLGWIAYVIYGFFTDSGIWERVANFFADEDGRYSPVGTFATCALIGILPLAGVLFLIIWLSNKVTSK